MCLTHVLLVFVPSGRGRVQYDCVCMCVCTQVHVRVKIPKSLKPEEKKLVEELKELQSKQKVGPFGF